MEFKGTKGEWYVKHNHKSNGRVGENKAYSVNTDQYNLNIAAVWKDVSNNDNESEANAQLIAAAPELLEALQMLKESVQIDRDTITPFQEEKLEQATKAINKALGL